MKEFVKWVFMNYVFLRNLDDESICNLFFGGNVVKRSEFIYMIMGEFSEEIGEELRDRDILGDLIVEGLREGLNRK